MPPARARNAAAVFGLWGLAVAQPLLALYGDNGTVFVTARQSSTSIVAFAVIVTFAIPTALVAIEAVAYAVDRAAGDAVQALFTACLGAALTATVLRRLGLDATAPAIALAGAAGIGVAYAQRHVRTFAIGLSYLAAGPLLYFIAFVFFSRSSALVTDADPVAAANATIDRPAPVVVLQLDELPVASLLRDDLTINADRFPNFAALADQSTWYPTATSLSSRTDESVPSVLTGLIPDRGDLPTARDHPRSLFTLLGDAYELNVHEPVAQLCSRSVCDLQDTERRQPFPTLLADASIVYGHALLPPGLRDHLPRIDHSWGGFLDDGLPEGSSPSPSSDPSTGFTNRSDVIAQAAQAAVPSLQGQAFRHFVDTLGDTRQPSLSYAHVLLPHQPWLMTPSGQQHSEAGPALGLLDDGRWSADPVGARQAFQRHLLQLGYVDGLLGMMIDELRGDGLWDEAVVVVTADHGVSFIPGQPMREPIPTNAPEIYHVPLFIKYPDQQQGEVSTADAELIDVLPTLVDVLGVQTDWEFDGRSLLGAGPSRSSRQVVDPEVPAGLPSGLGEVAKVVDRNRTYLTGGQDWRGVAAVAPYGDLVGQPLTGLTVAEPSPLTWKTFNGLLAYDPASTWSPVLQTGVLRLAGGPAPASGLLAVNGTVVGVAVGFEVEGGEATFSALITPEFFTYGYNDLRLFLPDTEGGRIFHEATLTDE